jgi:hypothetical protein
MSTQEKLAQVVREALCIVDPFDDKVFIARADAALQEYESKTKPDWIARLEAAEKALDAIASWHDGEEVGPHFDEPGSARLAREYFNTYKGK